MSDTLDLFDRAMGSLHGLPDVLHSKPATVRAVTMCQSQTFIVQTFRQRDRTKEDASSEDTVFLEYIDADSHFRLVIPPAVAAVIARQRDAISGRARSKAAKTVAAERMARGERPAFLGKPRRPKAAKGRTS